MFSLGAGKSSIASVLFRLYHYQGRITIDGNDIATVPLTLLRRNISIISRDPTFSSPILREHLDPSNEFTDLEIWSAFEKVKLNHLVPSLDVDVNAVGFSVGQRQLLCLARAILSKTKIVVLDEATAGMDDATEKLVHGVMDEHFEGCTVIAITHRPEYVLKCDKVLVVENGEAVEYDDPDTLLKNVDGRFFGMVKRAGLL